jgi:hypothetical protein
MMMNTMSNLLRQRNLGGKGEEGEGLMGDSHKYGFGFGSGTFCLEDAAKCAKRVGTLQKRREVAQGLLSFLYDFGICCCVRPSWEPRDFAIAGGYLWRFRADDDEGK